MPTRTFAVAGAGVGGAALLAAAGITYAPTAGSTPASRPVHRAAKPVHLAAKAAHLAAHQAPYRAARPLQRAPAAVRPGHGSTSAVKGEGRDRGGGEHGYGHEEKGKIYFNDRTYSAAAEGCITAASGLGSTSFNVFNDSRKTIEVFSGFNCDNGAPVATVGPHDATNGVVTGTGFGGLFGGDATVGSFLVVSDHDEW